MSDPSTSGLIYDLIGLGFGPANIAIGGAIVEKWASSPSSVRLPCPRSVLLGAHVVSYCVLLTRARGS